MSLTVIAPQQSQESLNEINDHFDELALVRFETVQPTAQPPITETTLLVCLL